MKFNCILGGIALLATALSSSASPDQPGISGEYLEVRSCDVYTGPCFANAEMGLMGKEGILVWSIRQGSWEGVPLDGLSVIAVIKTAGTLGDQRYQPRQGKAVLIVDDKGNPLQRRALESLARSLAGGLIHELVGVKALPIASQLGTCAKSGCAKVTAGQDVEVSTRCLGSKDHVCGNEATFYPPLTSVQGALPAYTELAAFHGPELGVRWESTCQRSAFLAAFSK